MVRLLSVACHRASGVGCWLTAALAAAADDDDDDGDDDCEVQAFHEYCHLGWPFGRPNTNFPRPAEKKQNFLRLLLLQQQQPACRPAFFNIFISTTN